MIDENFNPSEVMDENNNPLVSYCLFCYNQEKYIKDSILSALNQSYSPLEIIISDDGSIDNTFKIASEVTSEYLGPHKIVLNRNEINIGIGAHVSKVLYTIAKGELLVVNAGDDMSLKDHVAKAVENMSKYPEINMIDFSGSIINESNVNINEIQLEFETKRYTLEDYLKLKKISSFAPGRILRKDFVQKFNPINDNCPTEDSVLVLRSLLSGGFLRLNIPLIHYRRHDNNISNPDRIRKISHVAIIAQFFSDVTHAYNAGFLSDEKYISLLNRINCELRIRKVSYMKQGFFIKATRKYLIKLIKFSFRIFK